MKYKWAALGLSALVGGLPAYGQWEQVPDKLIPRTSAGEADLSAPAPRTAAGKPNLSGVWMAVNPMRYGLDITADYGPEELQLEPWAEDLLQQRRARNYVDAPQAHCRPTGLPFINTVTLPFKIVQTPDLILVIYEENMIARQIFLDGRKPVEDPQPRWYGYSTGRWQGDVLVVETTGLIEESWLDEFGHPHTESMRVTERFRRLDAGNLEIETTVDDPEVYSQPFSYTLPLAAVADDDLLEYFCSDNEAASEHYYYGEP